MNPASRDEFTIGYYLGRSVNGFDIDLGVRYDTIDNKGSVSTAHEEEHHDDEEHHDEDEHEAVSYTHLTMPKKRIV